MITVYPFASGSLYTASHAITASYAVSASLIRYAVSASSSLTVINPQPGPAGKGICLLTTDQYQDMVTNTKFETCNF